MADETFVTSAHQDMFYFLSWPEIVYSSHTSDRSRFGKRDKIGKSPNVDLELLDQPGCQPPNLIVPRYWQQHLDSPDLQAGRNAHSCRYAWTCNVTTLIGGIVAVTVCA